MTPRVKPPHTLVSVLHWLWYCRATAALSALANLILLLRKNTLPFPIIWILYRPHRRAYTSMPKWCPNIRFPHQQDFFPIRSVTKSSTSRFSHENLVEKFKIFGQDFVPIRTALISQEFHLKIHTVYTAPLRACINVLIESVHKICRQNLSKMKLCDWPNKLDATSWQVLNTTESVGMDRF